MFDIKVNITGAKELDKLLKEAPDLMNQYLQEALIDATAILEGASASEAPVDTGYLRRNIRSTIHEESSEIRVMEPGGQELEYAKWVHDGTAAHTIRPKAGKVLAFSVGGQKGYVTSKKTGNSYYKSKSGKMVFAKQVRHPGTKANPFFTRAVEQSKIAVERQFRKAVAKLVKKFQ